MNEMKERRLDRGLSEINHMKGRAPAATEELRSEERRRFFALSAKFGFTAAMVAAAGGTLLAEHQRRPRVKNASGKRRRNTRSLSRPSTASVPRAPIR